MENVRRNAQHRLIPMALLCKRGQLALVNIGGPVSLEPSEWTDRWMEQPAVLPRSLVRITTTEETVLLPQSRKTQAQN
jgi:hypothetical protein